MEDKFDIISNLPLIFLFVVSLVVFILFMWGGIILLRANKDSEKIQKGRDILHLAFWGFLFLILSVLIFYVVSYFIKKGDIFEPIPVEDFPPSPAANFPPAPKFIEIGGYYFNGPFAINKFNKINSLALYAVFCKKNENYDIIFINTTSKEDLLKSGSYKCWLKGCDNNKNNLYIAVLWGDNANYKKEKIEAIGKFLKNMKQPYCSS